MGGLQGSDVELGHRPVPIEDLGLAAEAPAQQGQVVEHGLGQVAALAILQQLGAAVALGQLAAAVGPEHQRQVHPDRLLPAEGGVQPYLDRRAGDPLFAAQDVADRHVVVVDDHGQLIGRVAVALEQDRILELGRLEAHRPAQQVLHQDLAFEGHGQADDVGPALVGQPGRLGRVELAAAPIVGTRQAGLSTGLAGRGQGLGAAEATVGLSGIDETGGMLGIDRQPLALGVGAERSAQAGALVGPDAEPNQPFDEGLGRALDEALAIGILDPQDEAAARGAREQPVEDRGSRRSHVHEAGGRRGDAGPGGVDLGCAHRVRNSSALRRKRTLCTRPIAVSTATRLEPP